MKDSKTIPNDTKKVFMKLGTCSRTFFYLLNREFGYLNEMDECAADPFAGGVMQKGHQCGMLWGSTLAVGAEAYRRCDDRDRAIGVAIQATQHIVESFANRTNYVNCRDVTGYDFTKKFDLVIFIVKFFLHLDRRCFNLAEQWTSEAIQAATEGLSREQADLPQHPISCASEVVKKMGASDAQIVAVAGFGGGMGLSGNACGALGAAIWLRTLDWCKQNPGKSAYSCPVAKKTLAAFQDATDSEFLCHKICGQRFNSIDDHREFIKSGGCSALMDAIVSA